MTKYFYSLLSICLFCLPICSQLWIIQLWFKSSRTKGKLAKRSVLKKYTVKFCSWEIYYNFCCCFLNTSNISRNRKEQKLSSEWTKCIIIIIIEKSAVYCGWLQCVYTIFDKWVKCITSEQKCTFISLHHVIVLSFTETLDGWTADMKKWKWTFGFTWTNCHYRDTTERGRERDSLAWKLLFIFQTCLLHWSLSVWAFHSASPGLRSVLTRLQETSDLCCCRHRWPPTRRSRWNHHVHMVFFSFCCLCCTSLWRNMKQRCMVLLFNEC